MTRLAAAALALSLALPAGASAATWTAPDQVSSDMSAPSCCGDLGFTDAGNALAVFTTQSIESHTSGALTSTRFITRDPDGVWLERATQPGHPRAFRALEQRVTRNGQVLVFGTTVRFKPYRDRPTGLAVRHARLTQHGTTFGSTQVLRNGPVWSSDFAASDAGDAAAAWGVKKGSHRGVFVRRAKAAGEFDKAKRLTTRTPRFGSVTVAVSRKGHLVVMWARGGQLFARIAARGAGFGPRIGLGPAGAYTALAAGPSGEVLVARLGPPVEKAKLIATRTGPTGSSPKTDVLAGPDSALHTTSPLVDFDRAGRALVAWTDSEGAHVATLGGGHPAIEPIDPAGLVQAMAFGPAGEVALAFKGKGGAVYVAPRGPRGPFAAGERASPDGARLDGASLAFDPATGQPVVIYLSRVSDGEPVDTAYVVERQPG